MHENIGNDLMRRYLFIFLLALASVAQAGEPDPIQQVNVKVAAILADIASGDLSVIEIKEIVESEGSPPEFQLYYNQDKLMAAHVRVGHETWSMKYSYYFYPNGLAMKLVEETLDRPDNPSKKAIIYGENGKVLWGNIIEAKVDPKNIKGLFTSHYNVKKMFRGY